MSEVARGFVLLLSVVLWLPVLPKFLDGEMSTAEAGIRYGAALLIAWGGYSIVAAIVRTYTPQPVKDDAGADKAESSEGTPGVVAAKAEVLVERRARPRDDDAIAT